MNRSSLLTVPAGCLGMISQIGACLLHVWTIILAFQLSGFVAAVISFAMPGVAEVWWAVVLWQRVGFWNLYTLAVIAVIAIFSFGGLLVYIADSGDSPSEKDDDKKEAL